MILGNIQKSYLILPYMKWYYYLKNLQFLLTTMKELNYILRKEIAQKSEIKYTFFKNKKF